jgi:hypothetical protein
LKRIFFNYIVFLLGLLIFSISLGYAFEEGEMQVLPLALEFGELEAHSTQVVTEQVANC